MKHSLLVPLMLLGRAPFATTATVDFADYDVESLSAKDFDSVELPRHRPRPFFTIDPKKISWQNQLKELKKEEAVQATNPHSVAAERINRGDDVTAARTKYGYYVAILMDSFSSIDFICGGSLLSPLFVLTAAHCVYDEFNPKGGAASGLRGVSVGFFGLEQEDNLKPIQRSAARNYYIHRKYDQSVSVFDLAVIELEEPIFKFEPIIPDLGDIRPKFGDVVTAIGLGESEADVLPTKLQEKQLKLMPTSLCEDWWASIVRVPTQNSVWCVYADNLSGGLCSGDSGGPIIKVGDDDSPDTLVGLTSFGFDGECDVSGRKYPDGIAAVVAGRDDLWGPLVCNSERVRKRDSQGRRLRPSWCNGREIATMTPPNPTPQNEEDVGGFFIFVLILKLIFGIPATAKYPYYAGIEMRDTASGVEAYECMGTLIHPYFVLTMAECVDRKVGDLFEISKVRVGWRCWFTENCGPSSSFQDRDSAQVIVHPEYRQDGPWEMHNVALIRLDRAVPKNFVKRFPVVDDGRSYQNQLKKKNVNKTSIVALGIGEGTPDFPIDYFELLGLGTTLVDERACDRSVRRFFDKKYGSDEDRPSIPDDLFACANRFSLRETCSTPLPAATNSGRLLQWGSALIRRQPKEKRRKRQERIPDILLGTLNFRTDAACTNSSSPDVYNRMSYYREWIQCVVCVGSVKATIAADLSPKHDSLCAPSEMAPGLGRECRRKYGISRGLYDAELPIADQMDDPQPPTPRGACAVSKLVERRDSTFVVNPLTGETAKCGMVANKGLEGLFCGENLFVQGARENCPHVCGLCDG